MEVILIKDIKGLGFKYDTVDVKPGYGRNYLIPQGYALMATNSNKKVVSENIKQAAHKAEKMKTEAEGKANKLENLKLELTAKIGDSGKIFGAITTLQIADALKDKGVDIDRKQISIDGSVKEAGDYTASADLHKEVTAKINFSVVAE